MARLETRRVALTAEQWRHLEGQIEATVLGSTAEAALLARWGEKSAASAAEKDAEFDTAILTSIRSAGA